MQKRTTTSMNNSTGAVFRIVSGAMCLLLLFMMTSPATAQNINELRTQERSLVSPEQVEAPASERVPTTIHGIAQRPDGTPIEHAVVVSSAGGQAVSDPNGSFTLEVEVPMDAESFGMTAVATINGANYTANRMVSITPDDRAFDLDAITLHAHGECEPQWVPTFGGQPGVTDVVHAMTVFDDGSGSGPALYVGGEFTTAGGVEANHIARWDGEEWSSLGSGMSGGFQPTVRALTVFDDGSGPALYAGGIFTTAGGVEVNRIAKWDGEEWSPLGSGMSSTVRALTVFDDGSGPALYAGGFFSTAGGVEVNRIARWDGSEWSPLGSGLNDQVHALTVFDDGSDGGPVHSGGGPSLYVGGTFTIAGGVEANRIARWNGEEWSSLGSGMSGGFQPTVRALTVFDAPGSEGGPALYAGGFFISAGGVTVNGIAKWDGEEWFPLGSGMSSTVHALTVFDDAHGSEGGPMLYAGGIFIFAGGVSANRIAKWNGEEWSSLGSGMNDQVHALKAFDDGSGGGPALYVGGDFTTAGGVEADHIARWDGEEWSLLGSGVSGSVASLTAFDDGSGGGPSLYAGGNFTTAGGVEVNRIAKWNGEEWSPLGSGMSSFVSALTVFDDGTGGGEALYAGGSFTTAGDVEVNFVAKWDGEEWSPLGSGMSGGTVSALMVFDDGSGPALYAGGNFIFAGSATVNRIAKWDGEEWSPLGTGMNEWLLALTVFDDGSGPALYAGGIFTTAGGVEANGIAKWDGEEWSPLGGGMSGGTVSAMTVFDDGSGPALYAGGGFTTAGGVKTNRIAKWDGEEWSPLGSGMNSVVFSLTEFDDGSSPSLYAGGWFTTAGDVSANHIAKWDGEEWSPLGSGMSGTSGNIVPPAVRAMTVFDDAPGSEGGPMLYAGGTFMVSPAGDSFLAKWQGCPPLCPPADLNCDGVVDVLDLLILLEEWGPCADPDDCPADLNGDGAVDVIDMLILLENWG